MEKQVKKRRKDLIDLTGKKFHMLTVIGLAKSRKKKTYWQCKCDCGKNKDIRATAIIEGYNKSCGCSQHLKGGYKELSKHYIYSIEYNAKRRGMEFNLTMKELWDIFEKQEKKCALTGLKISLIHNKNNRKKYQTASLDRIDSSKGYTIDNVQWVHKRVNAMKNNMTEEEFFKLCKLVHLRNKNKKKETELGLELTKLGAITHAVMDEYSWSI